MVFLGVGIGRIDIGVGLGIGIVSGLTLHHRISHCSVILHFGINYIKLSNLFGYGLLYGIWFGVVWLGSWCDTGEHGWVGHTQSFDESIYAIFLYIQNSTHQRLDKGGWVGQQG